MLQNMCYLNYLNFIYRYKFIKTFIILHLFYLLLDILISIEFSGLEFEMINNCPFVNTSLYIYFLLFFLRIVL